MKYWHIYLKINKRAQRPKSFHFDGTERWANFICRDRALLPHVARLALLLLLCSCGLLSALAHYLHPCPSIDGEMMWMERWREPEYVIMNAERSRILATSKTINHHTSKDERSKPSQIEGARRTTTVALPYPFWIPIVSAYLAVIAPPRRPPLSSNHIFARIFDWVSDSAIRSSWHVH